MVATHQFQFGASYFVGFYGFEFVQVQYFVQFVNGCIGDFCCGKLSSTQRHDGERGPECCAQIAIHQLHLAGGLVQEVAHFDRLLPLAFDFIVMQECDERTDSYVHFDRVEATNDDGVRLKVLYSTLLWRGLVVDQVHNDVLHQTRVDVGTVWMNPYIYRAIVTQGSKHIAVLMPTKVLDHRAQLDRSYAYNVQRMDEHEEQVTVLVEQGTHLLAHSSLFGTQSYVVDIERMFIGVGLNSVFAVVDGHKVNRVPVDVVFVSDVIVVQAWSGKAN